MPAAAPPGGSPVGPEHAEPARGVPAIAIHPTPSDEEAAAIVTTLAVVLEGVERPDNQAAIPGPAWAEAGRQEAARGRLGGSASGWGKARPGWGR